MAHAIVEVVHQLREIATSEVYLWPFAAAFAAAIGYGRMEIVVDGCKITRVNIQIGVQPPSDKPPGKK